MRLVADDHSHLFDRMGGSHMEDALVRYVVAECRKGRPLGEVLADRHITNRADPSTLGRLLEHPELVSAVGDDAVAQLRRQLGTA